MDSLFFLDPTPKALLEAPKPVRQRVYNRIAEMVRAKAPESARVTVSKITADHGTLDVVFGRMPKMLVVLYISDAAETVATLQPFESIMETLGHVDLSSIGLSVSELPDASDLGARVLEGAISLYCDMHGGSFLRNAIVHKRQMVPNYLLYRDVDSEMSIFIHRLVNASAKRWGSSEARTKFKDVLDRAERDPQVIERGARRFVLIDEAQLETLASQKNAAQMYKHFFEDLEPMEPFERIPGRPPGRLLDLS